MRTITVNFPPPFEVATCARVTCARAERAISKVKCTRAYSKRGKRHSHSHTKRETAPPIAGAIRVAAVTFTAP